MSRVRIAGRAGSACVTRKVALAKINSTQPFPHHAHQAINNFRLLILPVIVGWHDIDQVATRYMLTGGAMIVL